MRNRVIVLLAMAVLVIFAIGVLQYDTGAEEKTVTKEQIKQQLTELKHRRAPRLEKIGRIEDEAVARELKRQDFDLYYGWRSDIAYDEDTQLGLYRSRLFQRIEDYDDPETLVDAYVNSFFAVTPREDGSMFFIRWGFDFPLAGQLQLPRLIMSDGTAKAMPGIPGLTPGPSRTRDMERFADEYRLVPRPTEQGPFPESIRGEFYVELPADVLQFEFDLNDAGKTQHQNGFAVTLVEAYENRYGIEITLPDQQRPLRDNDIVGEAMAADGRHLDIKSEKRLNPDFYRRWEAWLNEKIDQALNAEVEAEALYEEADQLQITLAEGEGATLYKAFAFFGEVETARVTLLPRATPAVEVHRELNIPVHLWRPRWTETRADEDLDALPDISPTGPVYAQTPKQPVELSADELPRKIGVNYQTLLEPDEPNPQQIEKHIEKVPLLYPWVQSNLYISQEERFESPLPGSVRFFDAQNRPIEVPEGEAWYSFKRQKLEYHPLKFPEWPARVTATVPVLVVSDIQKKRYTRDTLPEGIRFAGNKLLIDYALSDGAPPYTFHALDADGRYIEMMDVRTEMAHEDGEPVRVFYYYGEPAALELWHPEEKKRINVEMDITLRPPLEL